MHMNLYRLELMKIRMSTYLRAVFGIAAGLLAIGILFLFIFQLEGGSGTSEEIELFSNWNGLLALTTALAYACFSILSAVISAKVIVGEYCGKNAGVLLSYPVSRKTVLGTKCRMISGITIACAWISHMLVMGILYVSAHIFGIMPQMKSKFFVFMVLFSGFFMSLSAAAAGIIAAAAGWKKRSGSAAVICALLMVCVSADWIAVSPDSIVWAAAAMSAVFLLAACVLYRVLADGIVKMEV